jgi:hypothetical protein
MRAKMQSVVLLKRNMDYQTNQDLMKANRNIDSGEIVHPKRSKKRLSRLSTIQE